MDYQKVQMMVNLMVQKMDFQKEPQRVPRMGCQMEPLMVLHLVRCFPMVLEMALSLVGYLQLEKQRKPKMKDLTKPLMVLRLAHCFAMVLEMALSLAGYLQLGK